jgi:hypothetical protein
MSANRGFYHSQPIPPSCVAAASSEPELSSRAFIIYFDHHSRILTLTENFNLELQSLASIGNSGSTDYRFISLNFRILQNDRCFGSIMANVTVIINFSKEV